MIMRADNFIIIPLNMTKFDHKIRKYFENVLFVGDDIDDFDVPKFVVQVEVDSIK